MDKITKKGTKLPISSIKGKAYLQVAYRLVWFREEHPEWGIETEMVDYQPENKVVVFKATIRDENGRVIATAHKSEAAALLAAGMQTEYREKAETGSIGRALALCGYGTQFEPELDEDQRIVDAPIEADELPDWGDKEGADNE